MKKRVSNGKAEVEKEVNTSKSFKLFPFSVFFIIGNEFCERFSFYGMRAILVLYFINEHHYKQEHALLVYHAFVCVAYFTPLLGSVLSDNFFGRYRVILWISIVYVFGHLLLTLGAVPDMSKSARDFLDYAGLLIIAIATGGIKPCVSAFGADQFPEERKNERERFFFFFYFAINAGSLIAIIVTPILRGRISCLGSKYCFPLAFGVPAVLMLFAFFIFLMGTPFYRRIPTQSNVIWRVVTCLFYAGRKRLSGRIAGKQSWIDYARPKYDVALVEGVKSMANVLIVFAPVVLFWALFDQQGSTWVLQARRMNGRLGNFNILPDQMNALNPICVMFLIPLVESGLLPLVRKMGIKTTSLRRMGVGGFVAALSFVVAAIVQIKVNPTLVKLPPKGQVSLLLFNPKNCSINLTYTTPHPSHPPESTVIEGRWGSRPELAAGQWTIQSGECAIQNPVLELPEEFTTHGKIGYAVGVFQSPNDSSVFQLQRLSYDMDKTEKGMTRVYLLTDDVLGEEGVKVGMERGESVRGVVALGTNQHMDVEPGMIGSDKYKFRIGSANGGNVTFPKDGREVEGGSGAAWVLGVWMGEGGVPRVDVDLHMLIAPNTVSMLYQIPQFLLMTFGEVLFSVSGLEFSYSQASPSMRSVMQALWLLTVFFGNLIAMGISGSHVIPQAEVEFLVYAVLMGVVMVLFVFLAWRYKYVDEDRWGDDALLAGDRDSKGTGNGVENGEGIEMIQKKSME